MAHKTLILVRHGQSEWNLKNLFTGWRDPDLTDKGVTEAITAGKKLKELGFQFDLAFTSNLQRAQRTLKLMLEQLGQENLETIYNEALNERDYGDLAGMNKDQAREQFGEDQVHIWRRSFDIPPPGGESLKDTAERVLPYYQETIWPHLVDDKKLIIAAHGNSLRALVMHLEKLTPDQILQREIATGIPLIYNLNADGSVENYKELAA